MIGSDDDEIVMLESRHKRRQPAIESFERGGIAGNVTPMTMSKSKSIKFANRSPPSRNWLKPSSVRSNSASLPSPLRFGRAGMREYVADLTDGDDVAPVRRRAVENGERGRRHGVVAAVRRAAEVMRVASDERPGNHPADVERVDEFARERTKGVETLEPERLFMRCDLEHAVGDV